MNIYITGLGSGYEVEHLVRLFYPMAPLTLTPPKDGADCVWAEKRPDKLWAMVRQGSRSAVGAAGRQEPDRRSTSAHSRGRGRRDAGICAGQPDL